jgi:hypothetical protein
MAIDPGLFAHFPFGTLTVVAATVQPMLAGFVLLILLFLVALVLMLRRWVIDIAE